MSDINSKNNRRNDTYCAKNGILCLNDDCLPHILKHLNIYELIHLKIAFPGFNNVIFDMFHQKTKNGFARDVERNSLITLLNFQTILKHFGATITSLSLFNNSFYNPNLFSLLNVVSKYCLNLRELCLNGFVIHSAVYPRFEGLCKNLEVLSINHIGKEYGIPDNKKYFWLLKIMSVYCRNLKELHLYNFPTQQHPVSINWPSLFKNLIKFTVYDYLCIPEHMLNSATYLSHLSLSERFYITGECLKNMTNLVSLDLFGCSNLEMSNLTESLPKNKKLSFLDICGCKKIDKNDLKYIVENTKMLEYFRFSTHISLLSEDDFLKLNELKYLKEIYLKYEGCTEIHKLMTVLSSLKSLKCLEIFFIHKFYSIVCSNFYNLSELKLFGVSMKNLVELAEICSFTEIDVYHVL